MPSLVGSEMCIRDSNRTEPYIAGMPFMFFWHLLWLIIGPIFLTIAYLIRIGKIKV